MFLLPDRDPASSTCWGIPAIVIRGTHYPLEKVSKLDCLLDDAEQSQTLLDILLAECGKIRRWRDRLGMPRPAPPLTVTFERGGLDNPVRLGAEEVRDALRESVPRSLLRRDRTW